MKNIVNIVNFVRAIEPRPGRNIDMQKPVTEQIRIMKELGWKGGPLEPYVPGKSIGGDRFGNYERRLPAGAYRECDIDTRGRPRGAKRLVFTQDGKKIYYTHDHYSTFEEVKP